ncbi:uncharacterized protein LOC110849576 [Folsomia candida]|uniref:DnaJ subfamily A member 1 n=1 Tax=Folsomia candida TaxID=158441 RepID=A0A226E8P7_FOLCA|nr:uncharacterized protein LOC110849576 [Folsomia candida]OXA53678.1 DnaJ subfamily A member 1 [Folsomia candida]
MANHHELYDRLNVSIDSSPEQIRSTFHRLSRQCHPDRLGSQDLSEDERNARLQEYNNITEAHRILSNPETRVLYDSQGLDGIRRVGDRVHGRNFTNFKAGNYATNLTSTRLPSHFILLFGVICVLLISYLIPLRNTKFVPNPIIPRDMDLYDRFDKLLINLKRLKTQNFELSGKLADLENQVAVREKSEQIMNNTIATLHRLVGNLENHLTRISRSSENCEVTLNLLKEEVQTFKTNLEPKNSTTWTIGSFLGF